MSDPHYNNVSLLLPMFGDNNGTTFTDYSPTPKTVTRYGDTITSTAQSQYYGSSGYFDGSGDYLNLADSADWSLGTEDFTIEAWVYLHSTFATQGSVVNQRASNIYNPPFWVGVTAARAVRLIISSSSSVAMLDISGDELSLSVWHHIAAVRNGTSFVLYVDGVSQATATNYGSIYDDSKTLNIGGDTNANYFNGYIQDLRITKGVARYTADFTPPAKLIGTISGTVTDDAGSPAVRSIIAFPRVYPQRIATTASDQSTGAYQAAFPIADEVQRIVLDDDDAPLYNDLIDRIIPE